MSCASATAKDRVSPRKAKIDNSVCNHDNLAGLGVYGKGEDQRFFDKKYFVANPTFPSACASCHKNFSSKKASACQSNEWSTRSGSVHLCKFGANISHACNFGLCGDCVTKGGGAVLATKRTRKRKNLD
jgi:hypothetical protein